MTRSLVAFSVGLLVLMFVPSCYEKVLSLGHKGGDMLAHKLSINRMLANVVVFLTGCFELVALGALVYGLIGSHETLVGAACIMLAFFTLAVTLTFWTVPFDKVRALHNVSSIGGLLLTFALRSHVVDSFSRERRP